MKQFLLICAFMSIISLLSAQDKATRLVEKHHASIGLSASDLKNYIVSNSYENKNAGTYMVYLQQTHMGLPVYNQLVVLAFRDDKLLSSAGERIKNLAGIAGFNATPAVTPSQAVMKAAEVKKVALNAEPLATAVTATKSDFGKMNTLENITAELMWVPLESGEVKLAWQVYLVPKSTSDYWLIHVDANENKVINEANLTVYCNFDTPHDHIAGCDNSSTSVKSIEQGLGVNLVNTVNYRVIPFPAESPIHPGGNHAIVTNPWTMAGGNAATLGWHNDGTVDYTTTRGNNVFAQEDRDNNNNTAGLPATSSTSPDPLNFDFTPDFTVTPIQSTPVPNQQFNTTNLFYWNNIIHDLTYLYGFDEVAGNFQNSNLGRGGLGSDYVMADAQDAGGTSNANFATPVDGSRPRMQMYLWGGSPQRDGDVDNGIVVHEYAHGISNRLTGGPATASCLQNAEQMGEGWSDYYALMYTQDWANSNVNTGFNSPRGIGTYAAGQTASGVGIRSQRYCTNFAVNNKVYATSISSSSHNRGEIWCATLWDMTWNIIQQVGTINPSLFNVGAGGGNVIALRLVTEGMKLQPCSPGFISGRNAILQADQILYGGQFQCAIKEAFRRRGMGDNASQGSSGSVTDQVPDFNGGVTLKLTQGGITQIPEGQLITYTNTVSSSCAAINNFTIRDTLPANVTYVSGGTYDAATRVVSFTVNQAVGAVQGYSFVVMVNAGSYFAPVDLINETVAGTSIPSGWSTTGVPASAAWTVSNLASTSSPNSFYAENFTIAADQRLFTTNNVLLTAGTSPKLSFSHRFNTEDGWDGGVVEISTNSGTSWTDLGPFMTQNGYNGNMGNAPTNVLANREGFTGTINSFQNTTVNLANFAGQQAMFRFRFGSDDNTSATTTPAGWFVDDIKLNIQAVVNMRSSLFNSTNTRVSYSDTTTVIIQGVTCANAGAGVAPSDVQACDGGTASFSVSPSGTGPFTYQWQTAASCSGPWVNIAGATASTLTLNSVNVSMNGGFYRVQISNSCPSTFFSSCAMLTISGAATITSQPANMEVCPGTTATFNATATGAALTYQWQISTNGGVTFVDIPSATSASLTLNNVSAAITGNRYRVIVTGCAGSSVNSGEAELTVTNAVSISDQPDAVAVCALTSATFEVTAAGAGLTYQWQVSTNGGTFYNNLPGETNPILTVNPVSLSQNGNLYRVLLNGTCTSNLSSSGALLTVNTSASIVRQPSTVSACTGEPAIFSVDATGSTISYQWQVSMNNGAFININDGAVYSGTNTSELTILSVSSSMNGDLYRVIVSGVPCGGLISDAVTLVANSKPGVVLVAAEYSNLTPYIPSTLYATVSPNGNYTYQWYRNNILVNGATSATLPVDVDAFGQFHVVVTGSNGCSTISNFVNISDSVSSQLFIYPNPNQGQFQVRYYSAPGSNDQFVVTVYDSKGARVFQKQYIPLSAYQRMDVDLMNASAGIYHIELTNRSGKRIATGKVLVR